MKYLKEIGSWLMYIAIAFVIASLLNIFVFQITRVSGKSMLPTLKNNDIYIISKVGNVFNSYPKRGDIVVVDSRIDHVRTLGDDFKDILEYNIISSLFKNSDQQNYYVKRVIGLPGDKIELKGYKVYRNGELLTEDYINDMTHPYNPDTEICEITVPEGHIWVMGDNRNHSKDSRNIGPVPVENVIGKLMFKIKSGK